MIEQQQKEEEDQDDKYSSDQEKWSEEVQQEIEDLKSKLDEKIQNDESNWNILDDNLPFVIKKTLDLDKSRKSKREKWNTSLTILRNYKSNTQTDHHLQNLNDPNTNTTTTTNKSNNSNVNQNIWMFISTGLRDSNGKK